MRLSSVPGISILALAILVTGSPAAADVTIGSKPFTESVVLGEIAAQLIETNTNIRVHRKFSLGGGKLTFDALKGGAIDLYPEYTGTAWATIIKREDKPTGALHAYAAVQDGMRPLGLRWLQPLGFNNTYALAVSKTVAKKFRLRSISDLVPHADAINAGMTLEFINREDGMLGLRKVYGLKLRPRGIEHGLAYKSLAEGELDLIDTYSTDGKLKRYDLVTLVDDLNFFPPYDAALLARIELFERHPELEPLLNQLAYRLSDQQMQELNLKAEESSGNYAGVATTFLIQEGLTDLDTRSTTTGTTLSKRNTTDRILRLLGEHLALTLIAVAIAILISVPLGIALRKRETLAAPILNSVGVIQTIPSLALLAFMISVPGLGLGVRSAITALFLYALLPIVRNTYTGLRDIDPNLFETAHGLGLTPMQTLIKVELPLAVPAIMAGIRTATVISIGVATLAAFVGAGGLGELILTGLQMNDTTVILQGAIPSALMALLADGALGWVERRLTPRGIRLAHAAQQQLQTRPS